MKNYTNQVTAELIDQLTRTSKQVKTQTKQVMAQMIQMLTR